MGTALTLSDESAGRRSGSSAALHNSAAANLSRAIVRAFDSILMRGAPTILRILSRIPALKRLSATVELGDRLISFPAFDPYWCRYLWGGAAYEDEIAYILRKLGRGSVLIDGGANIGYWSVRALDFGFSRVIAVEPNPELVPYLNENFRLNSIPGAVVHAAIHSKSGETLFLDKTRDHAEGSIGSRGIPVTSVTIADLVKDIPDDQEIIAKLDVEGAELAAIEGVDGVERVVFIYEDFRHLGMDMTRRVLERGMAVIGVEESGEHCRIASLAEALAFKDVTHVGSVNLVACSEDRAPEIEARLSATS